MSDAMAHAGRDARGEAPQQYDRAVELRAGRGTDLRFEIVERPHRLSATAPLRGWSIALVSMTLGASAVAISLVGCATGDATVELSAADALEAATRQVRTAVEEYHADVAAGDDSREAAVIAAFVRRVQAHGDDPDAVERDAADFAAALSRIRSDREVAAARRGIALDNVATIEDVAAGLRRIAVASLSLNDELQRYATRWIDAKKEADARADAEAAARRVERGSRISDLRSQILGALANSPAPARPSGIVGGGATATEEPAP